MVARACHPTAGRAWEAHPWGAQASQIAYGTSPRPVRDTVSKYSIKSTQDGTLVCLYTHVHTQTYTHACECTQHTPEAYSVTKQMLLLLRRADSLCALSHTRTRKFPVSPRPMSGKQLGPEDCAPPCRVAWALLSFDHAPSTHLSHVSKGLED